MRWLIAGGAVACAAVMFVVVPSLVMRAMIPGLQRRIAAACPADEIEATELRALSFGLASRGVLQARGHGALVLTADELRWFQVAPEAELRVPRAAISEVTVVRSHLGKAIARRLLHVAFTRDGQAAAIAWYVPDVDAWLARLRR